MTRQEAEIILQRNFKLPRFYDEQWEAIDKILKGGRVLLIEKTGFGKSLCFQFPATIFKGTTVIFSPLIALMRDQVKKLTALGISAKCINSEQTQEENTQIINDAKEGKIKILYIAPERQENNEWIEATRQMNLSMVVVDEAHCISVWGHDFRPAFRRIINLVKLLPKGLPVLATTATATKRVEQDIAQQIGGDITILRGNLMRDNFKLFVVKVSSEDEKLIWLGKNLEKLQGSGILYTGTRVDTEIYSKWFEHLKISSTGYNAGLDAESRIAIENGLMDNKWKCIISTNALGMGIDKPDIRFIIHTQIPQSPIHYYQEIGRAGRDGQPCHILLFYNSEDKKLPEAFIEGGRPSIKKYEKVIAAVKAELLGERDLMRRTNLKQNQIRVIKADLIEQGIIREVMIGKSKKYEFIPNSRPLNTKAFEELRKSKTKDLDSMIQYVDTAESRMKFLCDYLGDKSNHTFTNCDNTGEKRIVVQATPDWTAKLQAFREDYFPELVVESKGSKIVNGVASSYYGVSTVGSALHRSKYEGGGDFPNFLVSLVLKAFRKKYGQEKFDLVVYVPPTSSGDLVKIFAMTVAQILKFPISHNLKKKRQTSEQKAFENNYLKSDNVKDAFTFAEPNEIKGKSILLIDDIFDSGATVEEVGRMLTKIGALKIAPLVIAKTVGGDFSDVKKSIRSQLNSVKWKTNLGESGREDAAFAAPIVFEDYLIIDNCSNTLYCLNKSNGNILWTFKSDRYVIIDIIINQKKLVCLKDMEDIYYCIQLETGELIEKTTDEKVFAKKYQYTNLETSDKIQIDYDSVVINGKQFTTDFMAYDPEIIFGQKIIIGDFNPTGDGCNLYCIDTNTHNLLWKIHNKYINNKAVISQHNAYFGTYDGFCSIDEDGNIKYHLTIPAEDGAVGIPSIENGIAYFGCYGGDIYCLTL